MRRNRIVWVALTLFAVMAIAGVAFGAARGATRSGLPRAHQAVHPATSVTGACKAPKVSFTTNDVTSISTASTSYVAIPGMSVSFNTTGTSCAVAKFSAYAFAQGAGQLEFVTATLDGRGSSPTESQFTAEDGVLAAQHAVQFVWTGVGPGAHTVVVYFKSLTGNSVFVHRPSLVVDHK